MPIGTEWEDVSQGAVRVLRECAHVFIEQEPGRVERLREAEIVPRDREISWLNAENLERIVGLVAAGESVALVAATGIPGFVDPGWEVLDWWADEAADTVDLVPIGMSSALDAALAAAGTDVRSFRFGGHYPENFTAVEAPTRDPQLYYVRGQAVTGFLQDCRAFGGALRRVLLMADVRKKGMDRSWVVGPEGALPEGLVDDPRRDMVAVVLGHGGSTRPDFTAAAARGSAGAAVGAATAAERRAWSPAELARRIWAVGFKRWFDANPGWSVGRPEPGTRQLRFPITGPDQAFVLVITAVDGSRPQPTSLAGTHLGVRVEGEADPRVGRELGALVLALDRRGYAFE